MKKAVLVALMVSVIAAGGYWLGNRHAPASGSPLDELAAPAMAANAQAYVCPMHSHIVQDHPGECPICGMDLVVVKDAAGAAANQIHVDSATQHKLGVQLAIAEVTTLTHDIPVYGTLVPDESAVLRITPNIEGQLTRLHVNRIGQRIEAGQVLYELSSESALNLQYEYIDILLRQTPAAEMARERREQNRTRLEAARSLDAAERAQVELGARQSEEQLQAILRPMERDIERATLHLKRIGMTDAMLARLAKSRHAHGVFETRAQRACVVQKISARPGMALEPMTEILQCVDPAHAQIEIVLYADQLAWVEEGNAVTLVLADGETVKTTLQGLHPLVDEASRTLRVRMPVVLPATARLGDYVRVTIHATPREVVSVPKSAVMRSGRGDFVMRAMGKGHFMPQPVLTGIETAERIAIRDGLEAGDHVAVNGQFLLDAAASIADTTQRLRAGQTPAQ